jgi:hypothetical protein
MARKKDIEKLTPILPEVKAMEDPEKETEELEKLFPEPDINGRKKIKFRKIGGGTLRGLSGYPIIKPGQVFEAYLDEIPARFLGSLQCLDPNALAEQLNQQTSPAPKEITWKILQTKPGKWDVVGINGKAINESSMTEAEATELAKALNN